jgi:2-polyprenyl-3-methyl-5-hydroxy-6-metoxy-1,4-benzoquinol methylase
MATPTISGTQMKEEEIRPKQIFDEYLRLAERDTQKYFNGTDQQSVPCPGCGADGVHAFTKFGFPYEECPECQSLYVSPRPAAQAFSLYYQESESAQYWASTFYKETAEARREKLWRPKAKMVRELIARNGASSHAVIDIGGGYGIFGEEYESISNAKVTIIEPGPALAKVCRDKGLQVVQGFLEEIQEEQLGIGPKVFVSFELFEHLHDPEKFLAHLYQLMNPGDMFIFTTLSGSGIDIQALWEHSKSVSPPHHLNFLNPVSTRILLERVGFAVLDISTPGKLDVDILCNNQPLIKDRFWRTFAAQADEKQKSNMQEFVAANGLSSHMLAVCQKPK